MCVCRIYIKGHLLTYLLTYLLTHMDIISTTCTILANASKVIKLFLPAGGEFHRQTGGSMAELPPESASAHGLELGMLRLFGRTR